MLVARYAEPAPDRLALGKRAFEFDPEPGAKLCRVREGAPHARTWGAPRSEEHTSELQSHSDRVCRLLLEKKNSGQEHDRTPDIPPDDHQRQGRIQPSIERQPDGHGRAS